jgi:ferredoxin
VECIQPGEARSGWPTFYIDPGTCIDCGACVPECPFHAIFPEGETPKAFRAKGGEFINQVDLTGHYEAVNHHGEKIVLDTTKVLATGEVIDLTPSIKANAAFYQY